MTAPHPLTSAAIGLCAGAASAFLLPGEPGAALGLLLGGAGLSVSILLLERRAAGAREQALAAIGEVKIRLAANAIRLDALVQRVDQMPMREADAAPARASINELTAEVGLLGDLIQQVATTLADHDEQLSAQARRASSTSAAPEIRVAPPVEAQPRADERARALEESRIAALSERESRAAEARAATISAALAAGSIEVHLQPVVQLPQRRTRGYEALVRLRLDESTLLLPGQFLAIVEERGFGPTLDALVLTRALAIARHLGGKDGGLFVSCNFSAATWSSSKALATLARILEKYREHAGHLVIETPQRVFRALEPASLGLLGAMSANGVRFALDQVVDLRLDPAALFDRGVRFVKAPAALLLAQAQGRASGDIAAGDLAALLARSSITLIAEKIEDDPTVADMIELGVTHAQGNVFSPPRPVKPEVFADAGPPAPAAAPLAAESAPRPAAAQEPASERLPFRAVLRRASA